MTDIESKNGIKRKFPMREFTIEMLQKALAGRGINLQKDIIKQKIICGDYGQVQWIDYNMGRFALRHNVI